MKIPDIASLNYEQKIVAGKYIATLVILAIIAFYSISFAISSNNYNVNKIFGDILDDNIMYSGVFIEDVYVGGLTKEQAKQVADTAYSKSKLDSYTINFKTDYGYNKVLTYRELGAEYDIDKAVDEAYAVNRSGDRSSRIGKLDEIEGKNQHIIPDYSINEGVLKEAITKIVEDVDKEYSLINKKSDYDRTYDMVYSYIQIKENGVEVYVPEVIPSGE